RSEAGVVQEPRKADRAVIVSEENRNDMRVAASDIKTGFTQLSSQECAQCDEIISFPIGGSHDANRCSHLCRHVGRQCGAEDKRSRSIDEILLELLRTAHEAAHTCERFAARMNCNEYPISEPRSRDQSSSLWPDNSGGVRFIDDELGSISFR